MLLALSLMIIPFPIFINHDDNLGIASETSFLEHPTGKIYTHWAWVDTGVGSECLLFQLEL